MDFTKSPPELVERFGRVMDGFPEATQRKMFGYPAGFIGGNMVTGLYQDRWVVRLPDDQRAELLAINGAGSFEPMPGRQMKGYATLPPSVVADPGQTARWVERAIAFGRTLPPKKA
jgi:TfoX/Sxy family transcriptional regulator of competence genes